MRRLLLLALLLPNICLAGMEQEFVCRHCGLKGNYVQGELLTADQFVAFCPKDHFVHISWDYHKRAPKPVRVDRGVPVFVCPVCKKPIARRWDEKECPRCDSKNIRIRPTGIAVD
jgi:Zn finger protein HypA/HybF involved in hydrogenase expression